MADLKEAHLFPNLQAQQQHWYYSGKVQRLKDLLSPWLLQRPRSSVCRGLDFGAGNGVISRSVGTQLQGISIIWDLVDEAFGAVSEHHCPEGYHYFDSLPNEQSYDLILAIDVIEHIDDDHAVLATLKHHLRPGGILLLAVPAYGFLWSDHDRFLEHRRRYNRLQLKRVFKAAGFHLEHVESFLVFLFPVALLQRLGKRPASQPKSALTIPPAWLNRLLTSVLELERRFISAVPLIGRCPGLSLVAVARAADLQMIAN